MIEKQRGLAITDGRDRRSARSGCERDPSSSPVERLFISAIEFEVTQPSKVIPPNEINPHRLGYLECDNEIPTLDLRYMRQVTRSPPSRSESTPCQW